MEYYDFENDIANLDEKSIFANRIFKVIYDRHNGDLDEAIYRNYLIFEAISKSVRKIEDLIPTEVPMLSYFIVKNESAADMAITEEEKGHALARIGRVCHDYYTNKF